MISNNMIHGIVILCLSITRAEASFFDHILRPYHYRSPQESIEALQVDQINAPDNPLVNYNLGVACYKTQNYDRAIKNFDLAQKYLRPHQEKTLAQKILFNRANSGYQQIMTQLPQDWQTTTVEHDLLQSSIEEIEHSISLYNQFLTKEHEHQHALHNKRQAEILLEQLKNKQRLQEMQKQQEEQNKNNQQDQHQKQEHNNQDQKSESGQQQDQKSGSSQQKDQQSGSSQQKDQQSDSNQHRDEQEDTNQQDHQPGKGQQSPPDQQKSPDPQSASHDQSKNHEQQNNKQGHEDTKQRDREERVKGDDNNSNSRDDKKLDDKQREKEQERKTDHHNKSSEEEQHSNANSSQPTAEDKKKQQDRALATPTDQQEPQGDRNQERAERRFLRAMLDNLEADESQLRQQKLASKVKASVPRNPFQRPW